MPLHLLPYWRQQWGKPIPRPILHAFSVAVESNRDFLAPQLCDDIEVRVCRLRASWVGVIECVPDRSRGLCVLWIAHEAGCAIVLTLQFGQRPVPD